MADAVRPGGVVPQEDQVADLGRGALRDSRGGVVLRGGQIGDPGAGAAVEPLDQFRAVELGGVGVGDRHLGAQNIGLVHLGVGEAGELCCGHRGAALGVEVVLRRSWPPLRCPNRTPSIACAIDTEAGTPNLRCALWAGPTMLAMNAFFWLVVLVAADAPGLSTSAAETAIANPMAMDSTRDSVLTSSFVPTSGPRRQPLLEGCPSRSDGQYVSDKLFCRSQPSSRCSGLG